MIVGLVGPSGAGKSELGKLAEALGWFVVDADRVAHTVTDRAEVLSALCAVFGDAIRKNGHLDRAALAKLAFSSPEATERLNQTVLPTITAAIREEIKKADGKPILLDAPTLLETDLVEDCDAVIALLSDAPSRLARIVARDGISEEAARTRMAAARPDGYFLAHATHVLFNNGDFTAFKTEAEQMLASLSKSERKYD